MDASEDYGPEDFEIIITDNGSKLEVKEKVIKFFNDRRVWSPYNHRVVHEPIQGVDRVRMRGITEAKGKYIVFLDSHVLVNRGFFKTAITYMQKHPEVGLLHSGLSWNGYNKRCRGTAYRFKLDTVFWGSWTMANRELTEPWLVGASGLAAFIVRRKEFFEIGGLNPHTRKYGGGEVYLDLKYWMFGYKVVFHPDLHIVHSGHRRDYEWNNDAFWLNKAIFAYVLGGEEYLQKKLKHSVEKHPKYEAGFRELCDKARELGEAEHQWVREHAKYSLSEVLTFFKSNNIFH